MKSQTTMEEAQDNYREQDIRHEALRKSVRRLYFAAHWTPDRPVDSAKLWEDVRDTAEFPAGTSPAVLPFEGVQASYTMDRIRQIGHLVLAKKGREFGASETRAFLLLYGQELQYSLDAAVRQFLKDKLGETTK